MRVKICGITSLTDALAAINAGADAIGFVFYPPSPRYIAPQEAAQIIDKLPPFVEKVGLFVNETPETINRFSTMSNISLAQIHFDAENDFFRALDIAHIKVIRARTREDIDRYGDEYRLVDAYCEAYGGMGKRLNLDWFDGMDCSKIVLAGGLTPENVKECLPYGFYGLDVSSGVEHAKGVKDTRKVQAFITEAKGC